MSLFNPWFLIGALAVVVPIVVHLVRRERARRVPFPSLMFLRHIPQKSLRRRRLHHPWLLALRCLALLLLSLAFARPFIPGEAVSGGGQGRAVVILLDTSYSMQYGRRFERACEQVRSLITQADPKDRIALMTFAEGYEIIHPLSSDRDALQAELASLQPTLQATNYISALRGAAHLLGGVPGREQVVVLISDLQATGWDRSSEAFSLPARLRLIDVAEGESPNVACVHVSVEPRVYTPKYEAKLLARLTNFSDQPRSVRVGLKLNDRLVDDQVVRVDRWASSPVEFTGFNLLDGSNRITVELEPDPLPLDNQFFLTIEKTERLTVLGLESAPGASFYLQHALAASPHHPYALRVKPVSQIARPDLEKAGVVVLNDVSWLDAAQVAQLRRWVERGGGLIIATGRRTPLSLFNQVLADLLPARLQGSRMLGGSAFELLTLIEPAHPLFAPFASGRSGNFSMARFYGYVQAAPKATARVLARWTSGDPAVIESSLGSGKVLLVTSSLDTSWNDLPLSPLYVPLIHQMLRYLRPVEARAWYRLGETIHVPGANPDAPIPIDSPSEKRLTMDEGLSEDGTRLRARENGFYRLRYPDRERYLAVNLDFRESDLRKLNADEFVATFTGQGPLPATAVRMDSEDERPEEPEPGRKLWWPVLLSALVSFILETVVAGRVMPPTTTKTRSHKG